ncbi:keratin, type I cytoskeletal 18 [Hippoglossus stenolepis]|uniref:keratin, type I cytoskeletal 18 n=1 Tax=Hippoglossus stenolepis TaxID=195615 RepID=UPI00159C5740|nr:keratin, type I cytoskeletal 18 [Hippoglossus stenolepis]
MEHQIKRKTVHSFEGHPTHRMYAHSVIGGAGGRGTSISTATYGTRVGSFGSGYDYNPLISAFTGADLAIASEKTTMQHLNDRLAIYLEKVRNLEKANSKLEIKIREANEERGLLSGKDYSKYKPIIEDLRAKILERIKENTHLAISFDNARMASDDFRTKMEYELSMHLIVEADIARLRKILDDTNVTCLHLESDIESLREEKIHMEKNHEIEVAELLAQKNQFAVNVDVDAPKGQDLARVMEEMRAKYESIGLKNQEEAKAWHESQIKEIKVQVTENTAALNDATTTLTNTRRKYQTLDIELQSALNTNATQVATLRDINVHNNIEVEKYNKVILMLQEELTKIRTNIQNEKRDYENLLNIKMKLEAEIAEYRRLLEGGPPLRLEDAVDLKKIKTQVVTITQTLVDGKVVSEDKNVKSTESTVS